MTVTVTIPTATSIKTRFPEFIDVDDLMIEFAIAEARDEVGSNWTEGYNRAIIYLTAHYVSATVAAASSGGTGGSGGGDIASESYGRFSVTYAKSAASVNADAVLDDLTSTSYGRRFVELRDRNFGGPVIV